GLFFYNKIGSIISIVDLPTTNIIESKNLEILHKMSFLGVFMLFFSGKHEYSASQKELNELIFPRPIQ
ncbi:hypothetical protein RLL43_07185, partial [Streptococcus pneumoniae]|nr:hypothetical protein [Streptococcus pneumoniae]